MIESVKVYLSGGRYSFRKMEVRNVTVRAGYIRDLGMLANLYIGETGKRPIKAVWTYAEPDGPNRYWHLEAPPEYFIEGKPPEGMVFKKRLWLK